MKVLSNRKKSICENQKSPNRFLVIFGLILALLLRSQSYDFDAIAHAGALSGVE